MITINDRKVKNPLSITKLLKKYSFPDKGICILVNGKILKKDQWNKYKIKDGDKIEIVGFVGGG